MAKIVVLDDSEAAIAMLVPMLEKKGHTVTSFSDGTGLEDQMESDLPDLLISDIVMPNRNGYDVLRALKRNEKLKGIPVILMSTKSEETDVRWGMRLGAAGYVPKPFTEEEMLSMVDKTLAG